MTFLWVGTEQLGIDSFFFLESSILDQWWYFKEGELHWSYDKECLLAWLNTQKYGDEVFVEYWSTIHRPLYEGVHVPLGVMASSVDNEGGLDFCMLRGDKEVYTEVNDVSAAYKKERKKIMGCSTDAYLYYGLDIADEDEGDSLINLPDGYQTKAEKEAGWELCNSEVWEMKLTESGLEGEGMIGLPLLW